MNTVTATDQTRQMLTCLWRGGQYAYWWTPDGPKYFSKKCQEWRQEKPSLWFPTSIAPNFPAVPAAWAGRNVYFSVHPVIEKGESWQRAILSTVATINCVFAEYDTKVYSSKAAMWMHLQSLPIFPTCIVDSGGGLHAYWLLNHTVIVTCDNRSHIKRCQGAWVTFAGGDNGAKDLSRVLRLPGTQNHKVHFAPQFPTVQIMHLDLRRLYAFETIEGLTDKLMVAEEESERRRLEEDAQRSKEVASGAAQSLLYWCVSNANQGSRHHLALWLAGKLKAEGFAAFVADSVLKEFARQVSTSGTRQLEPSEMTQIVKYVWAEGRYE